MIDSPQSGSQPERSGDTDALDHAIELWERPLRVQLGSIYGIPETYFIDRYGIIRHTHIGPMNDQILAAEIQSLLRRQRAPRSFGHNRGRINFYLSRKHGRLFERYPVPRVRNLLGLPVDWEWLRSPVEQRSVQRAQQTVTEQ